MARTDAPLEWIGGPRYIRNEKIVSQAAPWGREWEKETRLEPEPGVYAISVNTLLGHFFSAAYRDCFGWFKGREPDKQAGWTITPAVTTPRGGTCLNVSTRAGTGSLDTIIVLINTTGLPVGSYSGTITVTPGPPGAPIVITVGLVISSGAPGCWGCSERWRRAPRRWPR